MKKFNAGDIVIWKNDKYGKANPSYGKSFVLIKKSVLGNHSWWKMRALETGEEQEHLEEMIYHYPFLNEVRKAKS